MRQRELLGPRLVIKVPSSLNKISLQESNILIDSKLEEGVRAPTKKELIERVTRTASIHARLQPTVSSEQLGLKKIGDLSRKNISSQSKLTDNFRPNATYRIKSTSKVQSSKNIRSGDTRELRTLESRMDTGRNKKDLLAIMDKRRHEDQRGRTTTVLRLKNAPVKHEDQDESSLLVSNRLPTNMRSEVTLQTEEDEDLEFEEFGFRTNRDLYRYDLGSLSDPTAEQLLRKYRDVLPPHAICPSYTGGRYVWVEVKLVGYSREDSKFIVQLMDSKQIKRVSRLSVVFKHESLEQFKKRIRLAKAMHQVAMEQLRFEKYVDGLPNEILPPSKLYHQHLAKFIDRPLKPAELQLRNQEADAVFNRFAKKFLVLKDMERHPETFEKRRLVPRKLAFNSEQPQRRFEGYQYSSQQIAERHYSKFHKFSDSVGLIYEKSTFLKEYVLFARPTKLMTLRDFELEQANTIINNFDWLRKKWRDYLATEVQFKLKRTFDLYSTDDSVLALPTVYLKIHSEAFDNLVREDLHVGSVKKWEQYIQSFYYTDDPHQLYKYAPMALIEVSIVVTLPQKKKRKEDKEREKERISSAKKIPQKELLRIAPTQEEFEECLLKPISIIEQQISCMSCIDEDLFPTKKLSRRLHIEHMDSPLVRQLVQQTYSRLNDFVDSMKQYTHLLYEPDYEKMPFEQQTLQACRVTLAQLEENRRVIMRTFIHDYHMIRVDLTQFKTVFFERIAAHKEHLLKRLESSLKDEIKKFDRIFSEIRQTLNKIPEDVKTLVELKAYTNRTDQLLDELDKTYRLQGQYYLFLEEHFHQVDVNKYEQYLALVRSPVDVKLLLSEMRNMLRTQESKFLEVINDDREALMRGLEEIKMDLKEAETMGPYSNANKIVQLISRTNFALEAFTEKLNNINERQRLLKQTESIYEQLPKMIKSFEPYNQLWQTASSFENDKEHWMTKNIVSLNYDMIEKKLTGEYQREILRLLKHFTNIKNYVAHGVCQQAKKSIEKFKEKLWLIENLTCEGLMRKPNLFKEMFSNAGLPYVELKELNLTVILESGLDKHRTIVEQASRKAEKIWGIEKKINEINETLKQLTLQLTTFQKTDTFIVNGFDDMLIVLDDQFNLLVMLKSSPYIKGVLGRTVLIESRIVLIRQTLEIMIKCQSAWMYLQPIFSGGDIEKQMPMESQKFQGVDRTWRMEMEYFKKDPAVWDSIESEVHKTRFEAAYHILEEIQKSLSIYLEGKRRIFPRFYFLSDDELIEILSQTKDPFIINKHIGKCFEAISLLVFEGTKIKAMRSQEGEEVKFLSSIDVELPENKGNVEVWLKDIEYQMRQSIRQVAMTSLKDSVARDKWILKYPAMIVLSANMIRWTWNVEEAIKTDSIREAFANVTEELKGVVELVRTDLNTLQRMTLEALVVIDVHNKDIVERLLENEKIALTDFVWNSELRYYSEQVPYKKTTRSEILVKMINASINYCYEYLGNTTRLVITPLTDRCYRTLMGAIDLNYGGAPEGPAGTGKTETVKDLAKAIAVQCVVFNCSDGLNYLAMTKFFKGLASSGAWCCFDEFNRIDLEVLSVIAQQVLTIQTAIKEKRKMFIFYGEDTVLVRSCAINITMNPGYAGRSELPDNLKALFRPCAMMVPDYSLIGEIYLYSVGFQQARELSRKIVASLKLSSQQLSSQDHYDFGMRALKSILTAAGTLKRNIKEEEPILCLRALLDVNMPKFTEKDIPLFSAITSDLFPGLKLPEGGYETLWKELRVIAKEERLDIKTWGLKVEQLWAIIKVRHGVMLVGQTLSGKTVAANTLAKILSKHAEKDFKTTDILRLNPKAITTDSLYGRLDPISKSWSDGILPLLMRKCISLEDGHNKWITFDGPVDAVWIENMNTVLDDNKKLCLTSGEIIKLINGMTMLFEVEDLSQASPATVSRCGMVYLEASMLGWKSLISALRFGEYFSAFQGQLLEQSILLIEVVLNFKGLKFTIVSEDMILVDCFRKLLLVNLCQIETKKKAPTKELLNNIVVMSVVWSIGAVLHEDCRPALSAQLLKHTENIKLPNSNIFDYVFSLERNAWVEWVAVEAKFRLPSSPDISFHELIVPTKDTIRNGYFLREYVTNGCNLLVFGPTGTSKSCTIELALRHFHNESTTYLQTSFSGQTTATQIQQLIESKMTTRKRHNVFAPEQNREKLVVFIDELNMPVKEKYGCQPPLELVRQIVENGGCYDLETKEFKQLLGMVWVSAMLPVKIITQRLIRHYQLIYVPAFEQDSLVVIYSGILEWFFTTVENPFGKEIRNLSDKLVQGCIKIFHLVQNCKELLPTPDKSHYVYNMRDLSKIFQGLVRTNGKTISGDIDFLRLWCHECKRVFQDRMVNAEHKKVYGGLVEQVLQKVFKKTDRSISAEPCFYTSLVDGDYRYQPIETIKSTIEDYLNQYNSTYKKLNMVLFTSAVEHIVRAVRILAAEGSHLLLIGLSGSGRKSVCRLAVYICFNIQAQIFESNWEEEVLPVIKSSGVDERATTFIVDDRQITREDIFEDISNLLNRSEIPRLITGDIRTELLDAMKFQGTPLEKYQYLVKQCKKNLHVVVCMSPIGAQFRKRLRLFPSLVNCTSIDWFESWSAQALTETAMSVLHGKLEEPKPIVECCVKMHQDVIELTTKFRIEHRKYCYVTPTNYLELLSAIVRILQERRESMDKSIRKYDSGTLKIDQTEKEVAKMKGYLQELQPKLEQSKKENQKLLVSLKASQTEADQKRKNCEMEERECDKQRSEATRLKEECQDDLNKVLPLLQNAAETLEKITKDDMVQLRSFLSPPLSAASVMEGMCYVFNEDQNVKAKTIEGEKVQDFWEYSKKNILNDKLIKRVKEFKIEQVRAIPAVKIEKLKVFMQKPEFEKDRVFNASKAAGNLSLWIRAVVDTYEALLIVDPKKRLLSEAERQLLQSELLLKEKQDALARVLAVLQELENNYSKARKEKEELEAKVNKVKMELGRAQKLTLGLSGEKQEWKRRAEKLRKEGITIIGDSVLGAGIVNYLGPFPLNYREQSIADWRSELLNNSIKVSNPFSLQDIFGDPLVISEWTNILKLPNDPVSIDNALIMRKSRRFPLMIDPQQQAYIFIKNLEQSRKLMILKPSTPVNELLFKLETCMQVGIPILLENVREISNVFTPLLEKNISNGRLRYGDKFMAYSDEFMFYMTTKDDSQRFAPETCMLVTLLNFSITRIGLTNQLQNMLLTSLYPAQSQNLNGAYIEISSLSHRLLQTEKTILELLEKTEDILGDDKLIEVLDKSKVETVEVEERLRKCEQTKKDIEVIRKGLFNDADIFSNWYFATESFVFLESVYRWSLDSFKALLQKVLSSSRELPVIRRRFFDDYYHYINRSLFEKHRLQFVLIIALNNLLREKKIKFAEIRLMVVGPVASSKKPNPIKEFSSQQWAAVCQLEQQCAVFRNLSKNEPLLKKIANSVNPFQVAFDQNFFYLLLLIRFLRPDKFINGVSELVKREIGQKYLESPPFDLPAAFAETRCNVPLLFLMTTGADPRLELLSLAEQEGNRMVHTVSLGQGQKDFALKAISDAMKEGEWVLLQNCHLSPSFMPELQKLYENFPQNVSDSFRLFLSSMPTEVLPIGILTNCVKVTFEPPASLKNTLLLLFGTIDQKEFEESSDVLKTLVFNLSLFHSVLLERRRFGPVGWNIPYEFTVSDFRVSLSAVKQFMAQSSEPWETINYMVGEAYYGGRVTDPNDRRFLMTMLSRFMNNEAVKPGHIMQNKFTVPETKTIAAYCEEVSKYNINQPAEVFGLHQNAQITSQILKTSEICGSILSILPQESEGVTSIATVLDDILKKLPEKPAAENIGNHPIQYEQSINTVLHQELERYTRLYGRIQKDLIELMQTQNGQIQTTAAHEELIRSLFENRVPRSWGVGKLSSWLDLFNKQMAFLNGWLRKGQPKSFFVPGFIFPQGFFTAILQNYSRKHQISVDRLRFNFKVMSKHKTDSDLPKEEQGCYIHGLMLEAARWNREENSLEEQRPNQLYNEMPYILIKPTKTAKEFSPNIYDCPVYKNSERRGVLSTTGHSSNFILSVELPTKIEQSHWVLRGTAMIAFI